MALRSIQIVSSIKVQIVLAVSIYHRYSVKIQVDHLQTVVQIPGVSSSNQLLRFAEQ